MARRMAGIGEGSPLIGPRCNDRLPAEFRHLIEFDGANHETCSVLGQSPSKFGPG